ncbi:hydroxyacid-oxoacid transhydrogenase, mitochondrial [Patella vulgata]|uniref:hydroxyacid-oxoacid transhydrogenase, mitochondrial n=1 Tax=Patella vulgata TaxID=6465 RepID=UPI0024A885B5|nr:hydroxyacid-oxoacid transhydrogenase, mitochondrial [Patella vulgata]
MAYRRRLFNQAFSAWNKASPNGFFKNVSTTSNVRSKEYAFEMACSSVRYGAGCTTEVGLDCQNFRAKKVCVMTDSNLIKLPPVKTVLDSLDRANVPYEIYDRVRVEPTDVSFNDAIDFAKKGDFDVFVAVGGGSVIDTCKAANLYSTNPKAELLDYVNAPVGKGLPVTHDLKPLIAVTTTAGTGSETTGVAVFDYLPLKSKTGIGSRAIRPTLGIVDPLHLKYMPERVAAYSGIDVLCHALESYTALPYNERSPCPENPNLRPAYQGSNPMSDIWCEHALRITSKYIKRAVYDNDDMEARSAMHHASSYAGIGFGNSGCHACHGLSYSISGLVKDYKAKGYTDEHPLIPHGLTVTITAPALFDWTGVACPERHIRAAEMLGRDVTNVKRDDAGKVLSETVLNIMNEIGVPNGLGSLGYTSQDVPGLVKGAIPQQRVLKLTPRKIEADHMAEIYEKSMSIY